MQAGKLKREDTISNTVFTDRVFSIVQHKVKIKKVGTKPTLKDEFILLIVYLILDFKLESNASKNSSV